VSDSDNTTVALTDSKFKQYQTKLARDLAAAVRPIAQAQATIQSATLDFGAKATQGLAQWIAQGLKRADFVEWAADSVGKSKSWVSDAMTQANVNLTLPETRQGKVPLLDLLVLDRVKDNETREAIVSQVRDTDGKQGRDATKAIRELADAWVSSSLTPEQAAERHSAKERKEREAAEAQLKSVLEAIRPDVHRIFRETVGGKLSIYEMGVKFAQLGSDHGPQTGMAVAIIADAIVKSIAKKKEKAAAESQTEPVPATA
jgi:hypothetical protein